MAAWDDASSTGSRESFKRTMSAADSARKPSTASEKKSYAAKLIPKMHPKNNKKDLCLPGDYKLDEYKIKIGSKSFPMNFNDKLFTITEPCKHMENESCCIFCEKTENLTNNCDFCGHLSCEDCLYKKRKF